MKLSPITKVILVLLIGALIIIPQIALPDAEFSGADDAAGTAITAIDENYVPWFESLFDPGEMGEMEESLFHFQQLLGVGGLGICFFYLYKKSKKNEKADKSV